MKINRVDEFTLEIIFEDEEESEPFRKAIGWDDDYTLLFLQLELKSFGVPDEDGKKILEELQRLKKKKSRIKIKPDPRLRDVITKIKERKS